MFAVVDIETSGSMMRPEKITEIGICLFDGFEVTETFSFLINPERPIDPFVTRITGITNAMVINQPVFSDVADQILQLTDGMIFTAHNVSFDYPIVKNEFSQLGIEFSRQRLCTVQAARKVFPGLEKYGLKNLCSALKIKNNQPHRALSDALATVEVLKMILMNDYNKEVRKIVKNNDRIATLGYKKPWFPRNST